MDNTAQHTVKVAVAFNTSAYYESPPQPVGPGKSDLAFRLDTTDFKSHATGWQHSGRLKDAARTQRIYIVFYTDRETTVLLDSLRAGR